MSQTQTRKQRILGDVKKKRRQGTVITYLIVAILIAVIVGGGIYVLTLPRDYILIPGGIGFSSTCARPLHTHDTSGTIHVETDVNQNYTIGDFFLRSEEHTFELQSRGHLVCRLLLEKKKKQT